ncbi:UDP-4-amino-4,6-dideoxy-N-acetyl-beta-L-altrosamine N-acetyltransferase [Campylobacter peloridis]|uniref:UDP-4-amino-4, 6-dideoxy-N-acetyl-beta-L-altrosamine N-acetyltransferase n=1 Tax=Campylobacter peloridis TaxID=488546 RepID=UPI001C7350D6|nr:UDP-4-amino-4,6-dideoxy-N-acetyl-beta-L-altrosamine N-acetyltransferase [Campylobacter peloridis]MBX2078140.1 UDP-4-amino-4,6-dideoxy-N-acetyl-beta-L-altrosamine N-acetyltransferase [Campylobacter peloridis]
MIILKDFIHLTQDEIKLVLRWRNDEKIAKFMKNTNIELDEHLNFINKLKQDNTKKYFLVFENDEPIGVIDFININKISCEFGLYGIKKGVGDLLMEEIKKYAFEILKIKNLKACVFKTNQKALNLYLKHNFKIIDENDEFYFVNLDNSNRNIVF